MRLPTLCALCLSEPKQLAAVMSFEGFGEMAQELEQFSDCFVRQLQGDAHDGQIIGFHGADHHCFFCFLPARD